MTQYDPRTADLADLRAEKRFMNRWDGEEYTNGMHWFTPAFLEYARGLYKWSKPGGYSGGNGIIYKDTPGDGIPSYEGGDGYGTDQPLTDSDIANYVYKVISERLREQNRDDVAVLVEMIPTPAGWEREVREDVAAPDFAHKYDNWECIGGAAVILTSPDGIRLIINLRPVTELNHWGDEVKTVTGSGHTNFKATQEGKENWYTKSRRGHDESFYCGDLTDFDALIEEQVRVALESRARVEGLITVPGLKWSINPADKEKIADRIRSGGHSFVPAAMGTGLLLTTQRQRWGGRAPKETEDYFGISPIYTASLDCD